MLSAMEDLEEEPLPDILRHKDERHHSTGDTIILNMGRSLFKLPPSYLYPQPFKRKDLD